MMKSVEAVNLYLCIKRTGKFKNLCVSKMLGLIFHISNFVHEGRPFVRVIGHKKRK